MLTDATPIPCPVVGVAGGGAASLGRYASQVTQELERILTRRFGAEYQARRDPEAPFACKKQIRTDADVKERATLAAVQEDTAVHEGAREEQGPEPRSPALNLTLKVIGPRS